MICTDCYSNLVIFNEFKNICKNSDGLLKKYQINKQESPDVDTSHGTKGNGKCKSIRNSEEMANRIKECAYKKSMTFVENMKNFYFLMNQIDEMDNGGQVIIKNEIASESLIPTVELNIKNEIIYPNEEGHHHQVIMGSVIQQHHQEPAPPESKRKKRKNNKRKPVNGQTTMEIDESGNLVARQIVTTQEQQQHHHHQLHPSNLHITQQNDNNEMALMLTVKHSEPDHSQPHTITVSNPHHSLQPIQIHSSEFLPRCLVNFQ